MREVNASVSELIKKTWWVYLVGGLASVLFGAMAFYQPGAALLILGIWFAAFLLVDGIFSIAGAVGTRYYQGWWWTLIYGLLASAIGLFLLLSPPASMLALVYTVAFFTMTAGLCQIALGMQIRKEIKGEWVLYLSGLLSVVLAALILLRVGLGSLVVVYMIATWAFIAGLLRIVMALRMRRFRKFLESQPCAHRTERQT
ncbi:MAG: HdeD family acid-resistance protein [Halioglobus sp.]|nr:HdeD family acid-resistance protein [Halioglobus sp.]